LNRHYISEFNPNEGQRAALGPAQAKEGSMTVFVYLNTRLKSAIRTIKVFATVDVAETWFEENDPEGVAIAHDLIGSPV
jgi:hypothetical protein